MEAPEGVGTGPLVVGGDPLAVRSLRFAGDEALAALAREDPGAADLLKLRAFARLTLGQAAEVLKIGRRTADRDRAYARAWLRNLRASVPTTAAGRADPSIC
jgi:hypothetical protein